MHMRELGTEKKTSTYDPKLCARNVIFIISVSPSNNLGK